MHTSSKADSDPEAVAAVVTAVVERWARFDDATTNPGFVVLRRPPGPRLYWEAVRGIVRIGEARSAVRGLGVMRAYKDGRGIIGAAAATAWRPQDRTYEVLTYRDSSRWGTPRNIDPESVVAMDRAFRSTFNNYDYENDRVVIGPRTACPVLFGIRGESPEVLPDAMRAIRGEAPERWLLFETNQGTDDHVIPRGRVRPFHTIRMCGKVVTPPRTLRGGHVVFRVGTLDVTAYEPSKQFRSVVRELVVGDVVEAIGAIRDWPRTMNLEKIHVVRLATLVRKIANPPCSACGDKRMKSTGRGQHFRCGRCGRRAPRSAAIVQVGRRAIRVGWYEPPAGSRRHLSKPLVRFGASVVEPAAGVSETVAAP